MGDTIYVHINNAVRVLKSDLDQQTLNCIHEDLSLINPRWQQQERYGRWKNREPKYISCYENKDGVLILPRGYINDLLQHLQGRAYELIDRTRKLDEVDFDFKAELHGYQQMALKDVAARRYGVLEAPPGAGKTVMALAVIARRRQPALIIVHTRELMYQWRERILEFTGLDQEEIGLIGDGHNAPTPKITIAIINSLYRLKDELKDRFGQIVVDECHHIPARTFTEAVSVFDGFFMLGLSATPYRSDGLTRLIHLFLGEKTHCIRARELQQIDKIMRAHLVVRETGRHYRFEGDRYQRLIKTLAGDRQRNQMIAGDVIRHTQKYPGIALVISERVSHCEALCKLICNQGADAVLLTGSTPSAQRSSIIDSLNAGEIKILVATSQLIGEGFDLKQMSSIFLATPVGFSGRIKQYIGRILRIAEEKKHAYIYDYVDESPTLKRSFNSRQRVYRELGVSRKDSLDC